MVNIMRMVVILDHLQIFLQEYGIVAQYTMPGTPKQNKVAEKCNRILKDMVRSMISNSSLPMSLWGDDLKNNNTYS